MHTCTHVCVHLLSLAHTCVCVRSRLMPLRPFTGCLQIKVLLDHFLKGTKRGEKRGQKGNKKGEEKRRACSCVCLCSMTGAAGTGSYDHFLNFQIAFIMLLQMLMCIFCAVASLLWRNLSGWYRSRDPTFISPSHTLISHTLALASARRCCEEPYRSWRWVSRFNLGGSNG